MRLTFGTDKFLLSPVYPAQSELFPRPRFLPMTSTVLGQEAAMNKPSQEKTRAGQATSHGEEERDNDAHRPNGSTGTGHDSTAQKAARGQARKKS